MKRCRPALDFRVTTVILYLTALSLCTPAVFAAGLSRAPQHTPLPANFQNLPGPQAVVAMPTELLDPDPDFVRMRFTNPPLELGTVTLDGAEYQSVNLSGEGATLEPGMPEVPRVTRLIMIGNTGNVAPVILDQSYTITDGVLPPPMQPLVSEEDLDALAVVPPRPEVYETNDWYPQEVVTVSTPATLRDVRFVVLTIYPIQVNPVTRQMRVYDNLEVLVENIGGVGENEIHLQPISIAPDFKKLYQTFENFEGSPLDALPVFPGNYLVICNNDATVIGEAQKLVNWRKRKGINASYVTTNVTGSTALAIRNYITSQYDLSNGQLESVCLIGDPGGAGAYSLAMEGSQYDNYFGCHSSGGGPNLDPVPDVAIGRIPATSSDILAAIVNKTVNYESAPTVSPDQDWFTRAWCAAHTGTPGQGNYIASNPSTKEYTRQIMLQGGVDTVFWNTYQENLSEAHVQSRLTAGISVFNDRMSWVGQTPASVLDAMPNTAKLPFVMSITCGTGDFQSSSPDISELWLLPVGQTPSNPRGAIGCVGIATLSTHVPFNNVVDAGTMYGLYVLDVETQGTALIAGKLQLYKNYWGFHSSDVQNFSYWSNLMGDPGVPIWRKKPEDADVTRPASIYRGTNNVNLTVVEAVNRGPIEGALVCLLKGTETYSRGYTAADGTINLPCSTATTGYLHVTITKDDAYPYLDSIQVTTSLASLAFNSRSVDDDNSGGTIGDNNDVLNPGETIDLTVNLTNSGTLTTVTGISGTLTTTSPGIQITTATSAYPNIAAGANANNSTAFRFNVTAVFNNEPVTFFLNLTSSVGPQTVRVDFTPVAGDVSYISSTFSGPGGNIDPGESGNLAVTYRNSGARSLVSSSGKLRSLDTYISVTDSVGAFGTVTPSTNATNSADQFAINVSAGAYNGHIAGMQLVITDANGFRDSTDFTLTIGTQTSTSPSGPDAHGYYAYDNTETSPPGGASIYSWIEIAPSQGGPGTLMNMSDLQEDDDDYQFLTLPFSFTFYGQTFTQITVCSNGWLAFGQYPMWDFRNYRMGTPLGPPYMVAAYWDDLWISGAGNNVYYYYDVANHWYVVEWRAQTQYTQLNEFFEIILHDLAYYPSASGNGKIKVQYNTVNLSPNSNSNDNDYASVGIQNGDHAIGLDYYYWNVHSSGSATLAAGRSIMYTTDANGQLNPSLTVNTPNGGENWFIGQPYNILWSSTALSGNVNISLNRTYPGGAWESLFAGSTNDGVQQWTVTGAATINTARVRVISVSQPTIGDTSNANFTLQFPTVTIITPNGGETLITGTQAYFQWTANGLGASTVSLNRNYPGGAWEVLDANAGTDLFWMVTGPPTSNARIRVIGNAVPTAGDTSNANFSIGVPPTLSHDPHADQIPGTAVFVAYVADDLPGFATKLFYRLTSGSNYDSLTMTATGNPDEYSVTTPSLAAGQYQYYLRSTDTQNLTTFDPVTGVHKFDVGGVGPNWLGCDDGTAEKYNWVNGPGFRWAVKFIPASFPFALSGARFAICPTCPFTYHDAVIFKVYLADGPGGLPGTVVYTDTTGPAGNIVGGLPAGAAWAEVITRINNQSLTLNSAFYLSVENSSPRIYPVAFAHDTSGVRCHLSYFWDECEQAWFNEDDVSENARPGNRMIRANGFVLTPPTVVIRRSGSNVILDWPSTGAPYYRIYSATTPTGPFNTLIGSVTTNSFSHLNAVINNIKLFYQVVSSDAP